MPEQDSSGTNAAAERSHLRLIQIGRCSLCRKTNGGVIDKEPLLKTERNVTLVALARLVFLDEHVACKSQAIYIDRTSAQNPFA